MRDFIYRVIKNQEKGIAAIILKSILLILSFAFRCVVNIRNLFYDSGLLPAKNLGKPVISVGNISWGGVGKTPFVIYLAQHLISRGLKPAILTRGFMDSSKKHSQPSDEAAMIQQALADIVVGVGADRFKASQKILFENKVDVFILDDGFQNRQVRRDLDIVLIDSTNPFGNGQLIPRGILRETLASLKRADIIVLTKSDINPVDMQSLEKRIGNINRSCFFVRAIHKPQTLEQLFSLRQESLGFLRGRKIISFCSIADPQSFQETLLTLGVVIVKDFVFTDHFVYSAADINSVVEKAVSMGVVDIVTTAKDAVKMGSFSQAFGSCTCWVLKIEIQLTKGKELLLERIDQHMGF